ncbi:uncharacterized protein N7511_010621 [Penicillium nucicola]|uniref:uncharacterized protein n=1 Tax=Penicillium nucicola TaxID=1850975 RepID=UPI002545051A|nr:uncharacterized protein N7511_010621 [Penicillium nucicola]KAJ5748925.1 hypothetical protein N7511_010621 [Penicillium nucicola]
MTMENSTSISLVDNTLPEQQQHGEGPSRRASALDRQTSLTKHLSRASIQSQLTKRKYAKWQPDRLGIAPDTSEPLSRESSQARGGSVSASSTGEGSGGRDIDAADFEPSRVSSHTGTGTGTGNGNGYGNAMENIDPGTQTTKRGSELDILYENQRGWFIFGVPRYSHSSLLNFDPSPWMTQDKRASAVNITNAQLPDPSWEWAWKAWYVDMSGDVDEQGWQYSFSFASSSWHGTQPWFHSFVRRRRWVRLRIKTPERRHRGRSDFEKSHMLTEDYFTIHSSKVRSREQSVAGLSRVESGFLNRANLTVDEEPQIEEIGNIPSLMQALKLASIDRERIDALKMFVKNGGDELYYLADRIPEIMPRFLFQTSRWQFVTYLSDAVRDLSRTLPDTDKDADAVQRKKDNLIRTAEACKSHITGPDVFKDTKGESEAELLNLTPVAKQDSLMAKRPVLEERSRRATACRIGADNFRGKKVLRRKHPISNTSISFLTHDFRVVGASTPMLSRGRPCLRRRVSTFLDTVTTGPGEPLLFLYPRWAAPTLPHRRPISFLHSTEPQTRTYRKSLVPFRPTARPSPSLPRYSRQWISSHVATSSVDETSLKSPLAVTPDKLPIENGTGIDTNSSKDSVGKTTDSKLSGSSAWINHGASKPLSPSRLARAKMIQKSRQHNRSLDDSPPRLTKKKISDRNLSTQDSHKLRYREYQREKYKKNGKHYVDKAWLDTKDVLEEVQQDSRKKTKRRTKQKEVLIAEDTLGIFCGATKWTLQENIWYLSVHNGCRVHCLSVEENKGLYRRVILSGTEHVLDLVQARIARAQNLQMTGDPLVDIQKPLAPMCLSKSAMERAKVPTPLIRGIWCFEKRPLNRRRFDEILMSDPALASVKEFVEQVEELTLSGGSKSNVMNGQASSTMRAAIPSKQIAQRLLAIFQSDLNYKHISTAALNHALIYLCDHELPGIARDLCSYAEHVATIDTFNILLKYAARSQDVAMFRGLARTMPGAHISPNPATWIALLSALVTPSEKADLMQHMVHRGYMSNTATIRSALQYTIQDSLMTHLDSGKNMESFIDLMVHTHGANWFSNSMLGQLVETVIRLSDWDSLNWLIQLCIKNSVPLPEYILVKILHARRRDTIGALQFYFQFVEMPGFKLSPKGFETLFLSAYKNRHFNLCRVLWRYACMWRRVTYQMRQCVVTSLSRTVPFRKGPETVDLWSTDSGKVIVGLDLHHESYPVKDSLLHGIPPEFHQNPLAYLNKWKPVGTERGLHLRLAKALVQRDIELGSANHYYPKNPLPLMLDAAAILDEEWRNVPRPLAWSMQNAIGVPIGLSSERDNQI